MVIKSGKWIGIVLHHTAGKKSDTIESVRRAHKNIGYGDIGYHYFVEFPNSGPILKEGRSDKYVGAHNDAGNYNKTHIGIALAGNYCTNVLSDKEYKKVVEFLVYLCQKYSILPDKILGHRETKPTACPGYINLSQLRIDVEAKMKSGITNNNEDIDKIVNTAFEKGFISDKSFWKECILGRKMVSSSNIRALFEKMISK